MIEDFFDLFPTIRCHADNNYSQVSVHSGLVAAQVEQEASDYINRIMVTLKMEIAWRVRATSELFLPANSR